MFVCVWINEGIYLVFRFMLCFLMYFSMGFVVIVIVLFYSQTVYDGTALAGVRIGLTLETIMVRVHCKSHTHSMQRASCAG